MTGPTPDPRLAAAVAGWQRALLDLTKRNRALNFRPTRVSTVAVVDEQPGEIFRRLVLRGQAMRFTAAPEPPNGSPDTPPADDVDVPAPEFTPYDPAALDARHTDDALQTALAPEALDHSLRRLDEQARLAIDEQGVNTLFLALGMLHYTEAEASDVTLRAPLLLVPVELTRRSARAGYQLRVTDDDPLVNPALVEWLRRTHDVVLPELPDVDALDETYDLQTWLAAVAAAIDAREGWSLTNDVVLALFSFQKFVMYKDLERNGSSIASHRLVTQLVTRAGTTDDHVVGLPEDVRRMDLDAEFPPERTYQVVDADSSQLRAIAAVARGHDLVVEGPPGTGKSQTITNLIARALAAGQSVLFVAEKMAALSVVHARLVAAGLGEFCLELHSTKANKRAVIRSLGAALDRSLESVAAVAGAAQRLPTVRATLDEYVDAVHTPHGALGATPFDAYGELAVVRDAPRATYTGPIEGVSRALLDATVRDLEDLGAAAAPIGVPAEHPWRDASRPLYTDDALHTIASLARDLAARLDRLAYDAGVVETSSGLPPVRTLADVDALAAIADVLRRSPGAPAAVLASERWNAPPPEATSLVERGRAAVALRARLLARLAPEALERDHAEDVAYVRRKSEGILSFLAPLDGRWRGIRARWTQYRRAGAATSMAEQAELMADVDRLRAERAVLAAADGASLFGASWRGEASDWDALDAYVRWVTELRALAVRHALAPRVLELAARGPADVGAVLALRDAARDAVTVLERLRAEVGWPADYLGAAPIAEIAERAAKLAEHVALGPRWAAYETARRAVERGLAAELLGAVTSGALSARDAAPAFRRAFWLRWLTAVVTLRPALERFSTLTHEQRVAEFRDLDRRVFRENQAALVTQLRERVQQRLREGEAARGMPLLRRELARQRGHAPLRKTLGEATAAVRAIKPCWMMSPLTVAQYLPGELPTFDLVIFDEASQLPVEDAVGAVIRGRQLVVVGDPKQLPPTNFFAASLADEPEPADGMPAYDDAESILEEYMGAGVPMSRLRWHYRSAHESLIAFSNIQFYDGDLYTFPSVETDTETLGLRFRFVEGGTYEGKGLNMVEARAVADAVVAFARDQRARGARGERPLSLGVGTFNLRQQLAIQDELEQRRRDDPSLEPFFDRGAAEPFFVKNLENIQGDERDVVFLSVTYARGADGRLRYNFGPLNGDNGWRRLNVLTTRARRRMLVFASMHGDDIDATTPSRGAQLLREFLRYAEHGRLESQSASRAADTESPFERDVLRALVDHGLTVVPQVGVAGYRVDLGVLDDASPGRFLCGIECDGVAYHASETARDRDRLRQQVLEDRGWTIHRVWSTDWFKDRAGQIEWLLALVEADRRRAEAGTAESETAEPETAEPQTAKAQTAEAATAESETAADAASGEVAYERPAVVPYTFAAGEERYADDELLDAPAERVRDAVRDVVAAEGPVHEDDLVARVAGMWGTRVGSRIEARIRDAALAAERAGAVRRHGAFWWGPSDVVAVRSRTGTRIPAERIAPEEYEAAVRLVLAGGHALPREQLVTEVRALLGFARTGPALEEAIGRAIDALLAAGALGEAAAGIRKR